MQRVRPVALLVAAIAAVLAPVSAGAGPQAIRGLTVPLGFKASLFGTVPAGLPTSLAWGPDTRGEGSRLYVTTLDARASFTGKATGTVWAFDDEGGAPSLFVETESTDGHDDLEFPLGIAFGPDGTAYVSDNLQDAANSEFTGEVLAFTDADGDGFAESHRTVIDNLPNGRHQANNVVFGPDGMLYLPNGNATDDGLECGGDVANPTAGDECPVPEVLPWSGAILRVDPAWRDVDLLEDVVVDSNEFDDTGVLDDEEVLVAHGMRNPYDLALSPHDPTVFYTAVNGPDSPAADDLLYSTDIDDKRVVGTDPQGLPIFGPVIDDMGFPSCLYNPHPNAFFTPNPGAHAGHGRSMEPQENLNAEVAGAFGTCESKKNAIRRPLRSLGGHVGSSGLVFESGDDFPVRYDGDLFLAEWGSLWNKKDGEVTGHKVIHFDVADDGSVSAGKEFMTGVLLIDVAFGPDGVMYVADFNGAIYRVEFDERLDTPDEVTVDMRDFEFAPATVAVPAGTTIRWVNQGQAPHNVDGEASLLFYEPGPGDPGAIDSPDLSSGQSFSLRMDQPGVWKYRCGIHPTVMHGTIEVLPVAR